MKNSHESDSDPGAIQDGRVPGDPKQASVNNSRRRFTRAGLAGSVVMTLGSRSALASGCSYSGSMSGNLSRPNQVTCQGLTPSYWKNNPGHWSVCIPGKRNPGNYGSPFNYDHPTFGWLRDEKQAGRCSRSEWRSYKSWANWSDYDSSKYYDPPNPNTPPTTCHQAFAGSGLIFSDPTRTMMQSICDDEDSLVAYACAALLNCHHFGADVFGYTPSSLKTFISTWTGSTYELKLALQMLSER